MHGERKRHELFRYTLLWFVWVQPAKDVAAGLVVLADPENVHGRHDLWRHPTA